MGGPINLMFGKLIEWLRQLVGQLEMVTPPDSAAPVGAGVTAQGQVGQGGQPGRW